ncbi:MAG: sensor histidine kinase [Syntrophothermus sp.]
MKSSIRVKLFAAMTGLIVFYVALSGFLNNQLLEKYYFYKKKNTLIESYQAINRSYHGDPLREELELEKLERTRGLHITILDPDFKGKYDSFLKDREFRPKPPPFRRVENRNTPESFIQSQLDRLENGRTIIEKVRDNRLNSDFVYLLARLNNGDYLFLRTPVVAIQESVAIANHFFLLTGLLTLVIGSILVFILAGRFTRPILELNDIAQRMTALDFSQKYPVQTRDEIGELGNSLNSLSEQLEKSISDLKEANCKLQEDIERERKIDEMRKEFISNVSHELKTPIALIQGYAEGLKVNVNEDEENKNFYCNVIMDEAEKMNRLVKRLLNLSQIESGSVDPVRVDFGITQLVKQVLRKNALIFKERDLQVSFDDGGELMVNADYELTEQVLTNYLNNAVNHVDDRRIIRVGITRREDRARVTVYNSGEPIPEESKEKIWDSFYKVDKARTRAYGGTGLGLSIVKAVQEAHRNGYGVNNVAGGVEFWFELDLAYGSEA